MNANVCANVVVLGDSGASARLVMRLAQLGIDHCVINPQKESELNVGLGKGLAHGAPRLVFAFSHYEGYRQTFLGLLENLGPGDTVMECNAVPSLLIGEVLTRAAELSVFWVPVKLAYSDSEGGFSVLASNQGLGTQARSLLESLAKRRLDGRPCFAGLDDHELLAACRATYRCLTDTVLQGLSEAIYLLGALTKLGNAEIRMALGEWSRSEINSPLLAMVNELMAAMDQDGANSLERVQDIVKMDQSDIDSVIQAIHYGIPPALQSAAFSARAISGLKEERLNASVALSGPKPKAPQPREFVSTLREAFQAAFVLAYAQSISSLQRLFGPGGKDAVAKVALAWAGSSLIQGPLLDLAATMLERNRGEQGLFLDRDFQALLNGGQASLRKAVALCAEYGLPAGTLSAALSLYDALRVERLSANIVAAGLDFCFGTGFERVDRPRGERYTKEWRSSGELRRLP